jgi:putative ABC transport system substrate-binding protein
MKPWPKGGRGKSTTLITIAIMVAALGWGNESSDARDLDDASAKVCVLYPDVPPPYDTVFSDILKGLETAAIHRALCTRALEEAPNPSALALWVKREQPKVVVSLGRLAMQTFEATQTAIPQIIGAVDISPGTRPTATGISLAVDPEIVFTKLHAMAPTVRRVLVVYDPTHDAWVIERARQVAAQLGLEVQAEPASTLVEAAPKYARYARTATPETDAIWLTSNTALIDDPDLLAYLIEQAWARRIVTFSGTLQHVQSGVLFGTFADTQALGRRLAALAAQRIEHPNERLGIELLRDIRTAVNVRVARHLGLFKGHEDLRAFDRVIDASGAIE